MPKSLLFILLTLLAVSNVVAIEPKQFEIPRTQVIPISDKQSNKQYELYIKLPENYGDNKDVNYPVIYFTDAIWHIELLSASTAFLLEDVILVGISWQKNVEPDLIEQYGEHVSRFSDYSFWKKANPNHPKLQFGLADSHLAFIRNDVFNYVEDNYKASATNRSYFGYSLGGLFGAYTLVKHPDSFQNYILGSPSVQLLAKHASDVALDGANLNANVFISRGDQEQDLEEHINTFVASLSKANNKKLVINYAVIAGTHQTAFPETGVSSITWLANLLKEGK